jgi:tRNA threonylcarbamoyladenosine biosynthesis protein TsaE
MSTFVVKGEDELEHVAQALLDSVRASDRAPVIALKGDLGAGKTALTKALARLLQIHEHVTSPTFVVMKSYAVAHHVRFTTLTHMDAYRIETNDELRVLRFEELLADPKRLVVIEWPERIKELVPAHAIMVDITIGKEGERIVTYGN